jgi:hypothetical protein
MPTGLSGFIIDLNIPGTGNPVKSVEFKYWGDLSTAVEPIYDEATVRGRSEEHLFYSHTQAENIPFQIRLATSVDEADGGTPQQIWDDWLFIKSFGYPGYGAGGRGPITPPRKARIVIGTWMKEDGVIKSPSAAFLKPYDENGFPHIIDVTFIFRVINRKPRDWADVRQAGSSGRQ